MPAAALREPMTVIVARSLCDSRCLRIVRKSVSKTYAIVFWWSHFAFAVPNGTSSTGARLLCRSSSLDESHKARGASMGTHIAADRVRGFIGPARHKCYRVANAPSVPSCTWEARHVKSTHAHSNGGLT